MIDETAITCVPNRHYYLTSKVEYIEDDYVYLSKHVFFFAVYHIADKEWRYMALREPFLARSYL